METTGKISGFFQKTKNNAGEASDRMKASVVQASENYQVAERVGRVREKLDKNTPEFVKDTASKVSNSVDVVSGAKLLAEVREMITLQEKYNDTLATKLEEALQRIAVLEAFLKQGASK